MGRFSTEEPYVQLENALGEICSPLVKIVCFR